MSILQAAVLVIAAVAASAGLQWWVLRRLHAKQLTEMRARHLSAQQSVAAMLQQARLQNERTQKELVALRATGAQAKPAAPSPVAVSAASRAELQRLLDEPSRQAGNALASNGFADTLPSRQFPNTSSFGLLQRASTFARA